MGEIMNRSLLEYPVLRPLADRFLFQRNDAMVKKIEEFLRQPRTRFVAVGAGHLVGDRGIVEQLQKSGYKVEQISSQAAETAKSPPPAR
jgi:uncharacterized protein YbaP (TraB family)